MGTCIYEKKYNVAKKSKSEAETEITRCTEALKYFDDWKKKVKDTIDCLDELIERNNLIASLCNEVELNGKPIDEGQRHYPNGNGEKFSEKLKSIRKGLKSLIEEISSCESELNESLKKARNQKSSAENTLRNTPKPPCGRCEGCKSPTISASAY